MSDKIIRYTCLCGKHEMGKRSNRRRCNVCRENIEYVEDRIIMSERLFVKILNEMF